MKAKATSEEGASLAQKKKKQAPTSLQFGAGTRKFFDYLLLILGDSIVADEEFARKLSILYNKEVESVLDEIL